MSEWLLKNRPLFKECIEALDISLLPEAQSNTLSKVFLSTYPLTSWGKIDWDKIKNRRYIGQSPEKIIGTLKDLLKNEAFDSDVFVEWDNAQYPVIKTDIYKVVHNYDQVTSVSSHKFIFNPYEGYIVEILHGDEITVGVVDSKEPKAH